MNRCYLGLGSNQKCPQRQIRSAITAIKNLPSTYVIQVSSFYKSKAWGLTTQQDFYNTVVEITTRLSPDLLLSLCQKIELRQGRLRKKRWGPRTIDIDIVLYGTRVINTSRLKVPHPYFKERDFVLYPLLSLKPKKYHIC